MSTAGVVAEYNPFHRGHAWHLERTRAALGPEGAVVCVMSGHWTQGGRCALADKWTRAALALEGGADLVLELPVAWATASAERFARGAVELLAATGVVDTLSFGSEAGDLAPLSRAAACLDSPDYARALSPLLRAGLSFPAARQQAARALIGPAADCLGQPNNSLGVEYLRAVTALGATLGAMTVPRRGAGHHGGEEGGFASATHIRALLAAGEREEAGRLLLPGALEALGEDLADMARCQRAVLARLRCMTADDFAALPDAGAAEGLPRRLEAAARRAVSLEEFYALAKTRRYTHARLRRLAVRAFLGLKAADLPERPACLRVLGVNERGRGLLARMRESSALPVITKPAHARALGGAVLAQLELEARATDLFALCLPRVRPGGEEWLHGPVVVEKKAAPLF